MLLHVDAVAQKASDAPPGLAARVTRLAAAHAALPRPDAGRSIRQLTPPEGS
jgi:hypothetical protein